MENKIVLVTGGARSGKSAFSERLVRENSSRHVYVATCPVLDDEMRGRVKLHRERRRGYQWITIEEQLDLAGALKRAQEENADGVLMRMISRAMKIPPERQFEVLPPRASMTILNFHEGVFAYGE